MKVLDLFCGLGGFSQAFRDRSHEVIGVDIVEPADIVGDILDWWPNESYDVILAAPPCTEFSTASHTVRNEFWMPDMALALRTSEIIRTIGPQWWSVENVRGANQLFSDIFGQSHHCGHPKGGRMFWGNIPVPRFDEPKPNAFTRNARLRSKIEYQISLAMCLFTEQQQTLAAYA